MSSDLLKSDAIIEGAVSSQAARAIACTEGTLEFVALAGRVGGLEHMQSVGVHPARHRSKTVACSQALTDQEREAELCTTVGHQRNVYALLHYRNGNLVIVGIVIGSMAQSEAYRKKASSLSKASAKHGPDNSSVCGMP